MKTKKTVKFVKFDGFAEMFEFVHNGGYVVYCEPIGETRYAVNEQGRGSRSSHKFELAELGLGDDEYSATDFAETDGKFVPRNEDLDIDYDIDDFEGTETM